MKNTPKNKPTPQPDLLPTSPSSKPLSATHATCAQLLAAFPFLAAHGVDETFLRNRTSDSTPNTRTGAAWIPKPIRNQYEITATLAGLLEWFLTKRAPATGLPEYYDSMSALENSPLGIPVIFSKWSFKNGCGAAQLGGSRVNWRPIQAKLNEIARKIPSGKITGIDGLDEINTQRELALKLREERQALERKALLEAGEMLLSRDGTFAINQLVADELIWEKRDQPLRALLIAAYKNLPRTTRTILKNSGVTEAVIVKIETVQKESINQVLTKLRSKTPKPITPTESEEA